MDFKSCSSITKDSTIVVKENKSRFEITNKSRVSVKKVQVDGCLINDHTTERCDWIIAVESINKAFFIELKGCGVDKAISQLKSTLRHTHHMYGGYVRECFAVTTKYPKHDTNVRRKKADFVKDTNTTITIKNLCTKIEV